MKYINIYIYACMYVCIYAKINNIFYNKYTNLYSHMHPYLSKAATIEDLPAPVLPTTPTFSLPLIDSVNPFSTSGRPENNIRHIIYDI